MSEQPSTQVLIALDVQRDGASIRITATVNGRPNATYSPLPVERVAGEVEFLVAEILGELRAQSLLLEA